MVLVDTSVWIDHLATAEPRLVALLDGVGVLVHPMVVGELALGRLRRRATLLTDLGGLPAAPRAGDDEVLALIDRARLAGRGIGLVDAHLLASALLAPGTLLWTKDRALAGAARRLGVSF